MQGKHSSVRNSAVLAVSLDDLPLLPDALCGTTFTTEQLVGHLLVQIGILDRDNNALRPQLGWVLPLHRFCGIAQPPLSDEVLAAYSNSGKSSEDNEFRLVSQPG